MNMEKMAQAYIVAEHNYNQEQAFKSGGIVLPKVKNYEEYKALMEMMASTFKSPSEGVKFSDAGPSGIKFDIPEKYRGSLEND